MPEANRRAFEYLYILEVGLRELIIESLTTAAGPKWYKALPADITAKYTRGYVQERAAKWMEHIEHHPLYHIDFPDLSKILSTNWTDVFQSLFGDKSVLTGSLKSLEPVRNKLAHNRKLSERDITLIESTYSIFQVAIGDERIAQLTNKCTAAPPVLEILSGLLHDIDISAGVMMSLSAPIALAAWPIAQHAWWFDTSVLAGHNHYARLDVLNATAQELKKAQAKVDSEIASLRNHLNAPQSHTAELTAPLVTYFATYDDYAALPRSRGRGHEIEYWRARHDIPALRDHAIASLTTLTDTK